MSRRSRNLLRYGAPAALFTGGAALLVAGWPAGYAWTLIVLALGWAAHGASAAAAGSQDRRDDRVAEKRSNLPETQRSLRRYC